MEGGGGVDREAWRIDPGGGAERGGGVVGGSGAGWAASRARVAEMNRGGVRGSRG